MREVMLNVVYLFLVWIVILVFFFIRYNVIGFFLEIKDYLKK